MSRASKIQSNRVLAEARLDENENIYSATFFMRQHISIVDQQYRAFELAHALVEAERIPEKGHIAIVGAGFTGMSCAVAIASRCRCVVHVYEKESVLLKRYRESAFRLLHPMLNTSTETGYSFDWDDSTDFPFMNWQSDYAHLVAEGVSREFEHYTWTLPIALHLATDGSIHTTSSPYDRPVLALSNQSQQYKAAFAVVILATGFGPERDIENGDASVLSKDRSYWWSGRPTDYRPMQTFRREEPEHVFIVGNGDSGVIELAHYLMKSDLGHRGIMNVLHSDNYALKAFFSVATHLSFREIVGYDNEPPDVEGPIAWYYNLKNIQEANLQFDFLEGGCAEISRLRRAVFESLQVSLGGFSEDEELDSAVRQTALGKVTGLIDELASLEIDELLGQYEMQTRNEADFFQSLFSEAFRVTVVGRTPTVYSRRQATINWYLLRLLQCFGQFDYYQGRATNYRRESDGRFAVTVERAGQPDLNFRADRLVFRGGPTFGTAASKAPAWQHGEGHMTRAMGWRTIGNKVVADIDSFKTPLLNRAAAWRQPGHWQESWSAVRPANFAGIIEGIYAKGGASDEEVVARATELFLDIRNGGSGRIALLECYKELIDIFQKVLE